MVQILGTALESVAVSTSIHMVFDDPERDRVGFGKGDFAFDSAVQEYYEPF